MTQKRGGLTQKEQARYRAITRQLAGMRDRGFDRATHPDFEPLESELAALADKLTAQESE